MSDVLDRPATTPQFTSVGTRPVRPDGIDKVTGRAAFGADFVMPGQLHGRIKRSPFAHARILGIDTRKALALPGVKAVVTGADFPDLAEEMIEGGEAASSMRDLAFNVMARDKVLYDGHAVAAVAAVSPAIAEAALDLIEVSYESLPHVIDVEAAMAPDAPVLHAHLFTKGLETPPTLPSNIAARHQFVRGDAEAALASAEVKIEARYTTKAVHQGYIEPHACVASMTGDGQAQVHSGQNEPHGNLLAEIADSINNFFATLKGSGHDKRVRVMTFSEFGRRVEENASKGTDHGAGSCLFVAGPSVKAGPIGEHPSLKNLDNGDLKHHTDFRRVYATMLDTWLGVDSQGVLNGKWEHIAELKPKA